MPWRECAYVHVQVFTVITVMQDHDTGTLNLRVGQLRRVYVTSVQFHRNHIEGFLPKVQIYNK